VATGSNPGARFGEFNEPRLCASGWEDTEMELVHGRWAGLDVHKEEVVAAVRVWSEADSSR
jgi:hypothetical protein